MNPSSSSCKKQWMPGKVTRIMSKHTVGVDGMPRHVMDSVLVSVEALIVICKQMI